MVVGSCKLYILCLRIRNSFGAIAVKNITTLGWERYKNRSELFSAKGKSLGTLLDSLVVYITC